MQLKKKIIYYGGCWPTNIGNAFIDYGSVYTIKEACPNADIYFASELPRWLFMRAGKDMNKSVDLAGIAEVDYLVFSGAALTIEATKTICPIIQRLSRRGVKIIIDGCGGGSYKKTEVDNFRRFLDSVEISGFISRDETAYNSYKDCCPKSHNGIDCAFFLSKSFSPVPLIIKDYAVYNFDHIKEPKIEGHNKKIIRTHHACFGNIPKEHFKFEDTLISDVPDDYLNLYANTYATYSNRVHACIATLSFGNLARLYSSTPRGSVFDRLGLGQIREKLVKLDRDKLDIEQKKQISFLKEIFEGG